MLKLHMARGGAAVLLLALAVLTACGGAAVEPTATTPPIVVPTEAPTATAAPRDLATATPPPTEAPTLVPTEVPATDTPLPPPSTVTPRPPTAVPPTAAPTSKPKPTRTPLPPTHAATRTPVPATPVTPASTLAVGTWGGQHIGLQVTGTGATYDLDCAHGTIEGPIALDAAGRFTARGTYVQEHGGPTRAEETPNSQAVTYTGTVQGNQLSLVITDTASGTELGKFTLGLGENPRVLKCM